VTTRREVLKYAGLGLGAAAASALGVTLNAKVEAKRAAGAAKPAQTEVTDKSGKRLAAGPEVPWTKIGKKARTSGRYGGPAKPAQTILGFGAAFTVLRASRSRAWRRRSREPSAYDVRAGSPCPEHGANSIGASDYSTAAYSYDDGAADPELKRFSIDHDRDYILPRCARRSPRIRTCFCSPRRGVLPDG